VKLDGYNNLQKVWHGQAAVYIRKIRVSPSPNPNPTTYRRHGTVRQLYTIEGIATMKTTADNRWRGTILLYTSKAGCYSTNGSLVPIFPSQSETRWRSVQDMSARCWHRPTRLIFHSIEQSHSPTELTLPVHSQDISCSLACLVVSQSRLSVRRRMHAWFPVVGLFHAVALLVSFCEERCPRHMSSVR